MRPDALQKFLLLLSLPALLLVVNLSAEGPTPRSVTTLKLVHPWPPFAFAGGVAPTQPLESGVAPVVSSATARIDLSCQAPSEEGARELAASLRSYLEAPAALWLRPPWAPEGVSPAEERARATYLAIVKAVNAALLPIDAGEVIAEAMEKSHDVEAINEEVQGVLAGYVRRAARGVAADPAHDPQVLEAYLSLLTPERDLLSGPDRLDLAFASLHGESLGQLETGTRRVAPGGEQVLEAKPEDFRLSAIGTVRQEGHRIDLGGLRFYRPEQGLAALLRHLADEGCLDLRCAVVNDSPEAR